MPRRHQTAHEGEPERHLLQVGGRAGDVEARRPADGLGERQQRGQGEGDDEHPAVGADTGAGGGVRACRRRGRVGIAHGATRWGWRVGSMVVILGHDRPLWGATLPASPRSVPTCWGRRGRRTWSGTSPAPSYPNTWYHAALADQLAGEDIDPSLFDISVNFSSNFNFYLGLDGNEGAGQFDLAAVALHELGHGLGFANFVDETTGTQFGAPTATPPVPRGPDIYSQYTLDVSTNKNWNVMNDAERLASAINIRKVSWDGLHVNADTRRVLSKGEPAVVVLTPAGLGPFMFGVAAFGSPITANGVSGVLVQALDAVEPATPTTLAGTATDGCSPFANAAAVAGKIALVDRGLCGFVVKVKNAQDAGAIAVIAADNVAGGPPGGLGGADPTITIPSGRVTLADGNALKAALPNVSVRLGLDLSVRAGTDRVRKLMMVAALDPVAPGSSISHFEAVASRNQLMEPSINGDLTHSVDPPEDLTAPLMTDIGWFSDADGVPDGRDLCIGSDQRPTVVIGTCNSQVPNTLLLHGCKITDGLDVCANEARNHGQYVACVALATNILKAAKVITGQQKGAIQSCAASSNLP